MPSLFSFDFPGGPWLRELLVDMLVAFTIVATFLAIIGLDIW